MSVWDKTTPAGSDNISAGDDRIRELKEAAEDALSTDGVFPGSAPSVTPVFRFRGGKGATGSAPAAADGGIYFDDTTKTIKRSNNTTYDDIGTYGGAAAFPAINIYLDNGATNGGVLTFNAGGTGTTFTCSADGVTVNLATATEFRMTDGLKFGIDGANLATGSAPDADTIYPNSMIKAWARTNAAGTFGDGFNISNVSRGGTNNSQYTYTMHTALNNNYAVLATVEGTAGAGAIVQYSSTTVFVVQTQDQSGASDAFAPHAHAVMVLGSQ